MVIKRTIRTRPRLLQMRPHLPQLTILSSKLHLSCAINIQYYLLLPSAITISPSFPLNKI
jgi:hypothetical protein